MKNELVVPNYKVMIETSFTLLALVASGWLLIKLISACFWLPEFLKKWQLEETKLLLDQRLKERNEKEKAEAETAVKESSGETTDSEKSKDDFEKIAQSEAAEIDDDATKKNK